MLAFRRLAEGGTRIWIVSELVPTHFSLPLASLSPPTLSPSFFAPVASTSDETYACTNDPREISHRPRASHLLYTETKIDRNIFVGAGELPLERQSIRTNQLNLERKCPKLRIGIQSHSHTTITRAKHWRQYIQDVDIKKNQSKTETKKSAHKKRLSTIRLEVHVS